MLKILTAAIVVLFLVGCATAKGVPDAPDPGKMP